MKAYTYKDSDIEWLGAVPSHWTYDKLFRLCDNVGSGGTPQSTNQSYYDGDIFWVQSGDLTDSYVYDTKKKINELAIQNSSAKVFPENTLLVAMYGATIGKVGIMTFEGAINQACCALDFSSKINPKFSYYLMLNARDYLITQAYGGGQQNISQETLKQLHLFYPSVEEQKAIVDFLDKATARIDRIISIKQMQLVKVKAVFKSKIEHLFSYDLECKSNTKKGLEYLGCIPDLWKVTQLKFVLDFLDSRRIPLSGAIRGEMTEKKFDYYGASGVIDKVEDYIFDEPLILIGEDGANLVTRSKTLVFIAQGKYWVNNHAHILKPKFGDIEFWTYLLENLDYSLFITGAAQPKLSQGNLGKMRIAFPKEESKRKVILDKIKKFEVTTKKQQINLECQIKTLQSYRKSLIHECVTGKKQVTDRVE